MLRQATCLLCDPNVVTPSSAGKAHRPVRRIALWYKNVIGTYAAWVLRSPQGQRPDARGLPEPIANRLRLHRDALNPPRPSDMKHKRAAMLMFIVGEAWGVARYARY